MNSNKAKRHEFFREIDPEYHFFRLFDHLHGINFFAKNENGELIFADQGILDIFGLQSEEEVIGKTDFDFLPRHLAEKYRKDDLKIMSTTEPMLNMIEIFLNVQGIPGWFMTNKLPLFSCERKVIGVMGTIQALDQPFSYQFKNLAIQPALQYIEDHFRESLSIKMLAEMCDYSVRQFERIFKIHFNTTPQQFIIKRRILEACDQIRDRKIELSQLSTDLGFYDQSSFTKQFRKHMGLTPLQYKKKFGF